MQTVKSILLHVAFSVMIFLNVPVLTNDSM